MRILAGCCLFLALATVAGIAQAQTRKYEFALVTGMGTPVCDAYVERLNRSEFINYPFCDRPEDDSVPGFVKRTRVPLSAEEVERLYNAAVGFTIFGDTEHYPKLDQSRRELGLFVPPDSSARAGQQAARDQAALLSRGGPPLFYRFDPKVDVDNDGIRDDVIVWKDTNPCGFVRFDLPEPMSTHLIALDARGSVDGVKTKAIFGHPRGDSVIFTGPDGQPYTFTFRDRFRTLGYSFGVFEYRGTFYFDTFYGSTGDFDNERVEAPGVTETLAVLKHQGGRTNLVCELLWRDPPPRNVSEQQGAR